MSALTQASIRAGQTWRERHTPHYWLIDMIHRQISPVYKTAVYLRGDLNPKERREISGEELLRDYDLEARPRG